MLIKDIKKSRHIKSYLKQGLIDRRRRELALFKERRSKGLCCAQVGHGPGHQSSTFCEKRGKHKIHGCRYGCYDQYTEWRKMQGFTGYFDEPKEITKW